MSEKTIYLVSYGSYSDYSVCALFDSEELANKYIELQEYVSDYRIEEFTLNSFERRVRDGYRSYTVRMGKQGNTISIEMKDYQEEYAGFIYWRDLNGEAMLLVDTFAKDEQHAVKIANEKRVQLIAAGEWPEKAVEKAVVPSGQ